jgi:hypothetical protein
MRNFDPRDRFPRKSQVADFTLARGSGYTHPDDHLQHSRFISLRQTRSHPVCQRRFLWKPIVLPALRRKHLKVRVSKENQAIE